MILGSDGVFDNLYAHEVVRIVNDTFRNYAEEQGIAEFIPQSAAVLQQVCKKIVLAAHEKSGPWEGRDGGFCISLLFFRRGRRGRGSPAGDIARGGQGLFTIGMVSWVRVRLVRPILDHHEQYEQCNNIHNAACFA